MGFANLWHSSPRWNSTSDLMQSIYELKDPVVDTLNKIEDAPVDFLPRDWKLMRQVKMVLQPFKDATEQLSFHDASISMVIPTVTMIIDTLAEETSDDIGVLGLKRHLREEMELRFSGIESKEHYAIATILDGKYKKCFFQDSDMFEAAKALLVEKLVQAVMTATGETGANIQVILLLHG